ncbi:MAG: hypothetical protein IJ880_05920 [Bacilli bacterium]|nr:hypothetical protein [Bacilli bacterium]
MGGQLRYRSDESAQRSAKENLDNIQYELTIKAKQEEIDLVEQEIDKLNDEKQKYQDQIDAISKKIELLNEQKDANSEIIEGINEQNEALDEQITKIEEEYAKMKEGVESYKKEWEEIAKLAEKAADAALLSSIGFDPELIKNLDPESLKNFDAIYSSILGSLNANDEEMTDALQNLSGKTLGDYLSSTADGIAALDKLDLSSVNTAIQTASSGVLAMNDGFALAAQIIPTISTQLDGVAKSAEGAVAVIGTAISTEKSESNGTLASSISEVGEISDEALGAEEGVQADLIGIQEEAIEATNKIGDIQTALEELTSKTYEVKINVTKSDASVSLEAKGTVGNAYADGYPGLKSSELALRSEYGQPELTVYPNGSYELTNTPTLSHLPKDTVIFNEEQTKRILKKGGISGKAYADGNATSSQFKSLAEVMPDKAAIFEKFNANLQANLEAIKTNALNIANNTAEIARAAVNTINQSPTVVLNGGINVTCPGVTETEVAKNLGTALSNQLSSIFQGAALRADQWAMRR